MSHEIDAMNSGLADHMAEFPGPWPSEVRVFDVTAKVTDDLLVSALTTRTAYTCNGVWEARCTVAIWVDDWLEENGPADPWVALQAYLDDL